jgi:CDP-diacylglycerol--glycerol-3-phosphate 3-phosphatidyltransferase
MKNKIPLVLIYSRLVFSGAILLLTTFKPLHYQAIVVFFIAAGLLSDIFDGIIARHLNISTEKLRRLDSTIDQVFWLCIVLCAYLAGPAFFKQHLLPILIVLGLETLCYLLSFIKFKKEVATHAIASKIWTLSLFAFLVQIILTGNSSFLFYTCIYLGIATRLEIIAILLILNRWTNDIPSVYHAVLIRKGKAIKKNKLFNG